MVGAVISMEPAVANVGPKPIFAIIPETAMGPEESIRKVPVVPPLSVRISIVEFGDMLRLPT